MIKAAPKAANKTAHVIAGCDMCDTVTEVKTAYERKNGTFRPNEGQVIQKLTHNGWSYIKGSLLCPTCEEQRRATTNANTKVDIMTTTEEPKQPSREQKRQIVALLTEVYDTKTGCYTGGETDKTVAETIGNGVMLGWVSQIREDLFGPDGNDELNDLKEEVAALTKATSDVAKKCSEDIQSALSALREYNGLRQTLADLETRVNKLKKAIGPRAEKV